MTEEEKEAIKYLEFLSNEKCECEACQHAKKEYKTISNLIKKQQKEIEREKQYTDFYKDLCNKQQKEIEEKRIIIFAGAEKVKQLEKGNRSLMESRIKWKNRYYKEKEKEQNLIFQLKDEEKELIEVTQNIISKDKIMAKIEELEKQAKEMKYDYDVSYAEEDLFNKNVKFFKEQMQELLEEPKLLEESK